MLDQHLDVVRAGGRDQIGRAVLRRGRRRVGKSRLVEAFAERSGVPFVFFSVVRGDDSIRSAGELIRSVWEESSLTKRAEFAGVTPDGWMTALRLVAQAVPDDEPTIVVLDEVPWLVEADPSFEGILQSAWDRHLSRKPVLVVLVGSPTCQ